ncbi:MAG: hypothetical protein H6566_14265 [Lewinellaceae bacterium]|nr:hypothetical protein [Lewinellaceae bacterium]
MKKIFTGNEDFNKTAFLNWRTSKHEDIGNMLVLAEGFLSSAIELSKTCIKDNKDKKADMLIFPILMNANHGIELYLKSLIWTLNKLTNSKFKIEGKHDIQQMFQTVQAKIKDYKDNDWLASFNEKNQNLAEYIDELFLLISTAGDKDNMDFSRYPITKKYENHFYVDSLNNVEIDLENFAERFEQIKEALDERASYFFYQELKGEW